MPSANGSCGTNAAHRRSNANNGNVTLRRPAATPGDAFPEGTVLKHFRTSRRRMLRDALLASAIAAAATGIPHGAYAHGAYAPGHAAAKQLRTSEAAKIAKKEVVTKREVVAAVSHADREQRGILRAKLFASHPTLHATAPRAVERDVSDGGTSGMASIYSDSHTASGEVMSSGAMTAAHRSLPFGTHVTVVNKNNGRSVVVRINDRGPFVHGRVIDLSPAAARALGIDGLASVSLSVLRRAERQAEADDAVEQATQAVDEATSDADHGAVDHVEAVQTTNDQHADAR
jgi:rare lipoprotein A